MKSFNSAAAVMPRKREELAPTGQISRASIRPRLLCRGNAAGNWMAEYFGARLQFGRGCYAAETEEAHDRIFERVVASIRPRLLCRGNHEGNGFHTYAPAASIRPRLLCRGNDRHRKQFDENQVVASIRPRLLCRGNTWRCSKGRAARRCFNSAAAVMPRKRPRLRLCLRQRRRASIRPRLLCRGNRSQTTPIAPPETSFNSAAAVMPRKR